MPNVKRVMMGLALIMFAATAASAQLTSNQMAPNFKLNDTKGRPHALAEYKGKYVVMEWFNPDCPFVKKHYNSGNIPLLQKQYTSRGVIWLSINSSARGKQGSYKPQKFDQFMKDNGASPTAVLIDKSGFVGHLYDAQTTPSIFVINPKGVLIYQGAIDDIPSANIEDLHKAKNYVRAALDAAMVGRPVAVSATKSYGCSVKY